MYFLANFMFRKYLGSMPFVDLNRKFGIFFRPFLCDRYVLLLQLEPFNPY